MNKITDFWKILIIDDDSSVHKMTQLVLKNFTYKNKGVKFFSAYNHQEAELLLKEHPDAALILLDIIMDESDTGLQLVNYIRNTLNNKYSRIVLRTGEPGSAPECDIIYEYDIDDYKEKTELSHTKLFTLLHSSIRTFDALMEQKHTNEHLDKLVKEKTKQLQELNASLEEEVKIALEKQIKQEELFIERAKLADMGEMISMISHQWRQPLNEIALRVGAQKIAMLQGRFEPENVNKVFDSIEEKVQYLSQTIDDFRNFLKPHKDIVSTPIDSFMQKFDNFISFKIKDTGTSFKVTNSTTAQYNIYENELLQVLINIANNALDAIKEKEVTAPYLHISVYEENSYLCFSMEDNAGGISKELEAKVFDKYFTTKGKDGTGLGLYMAKVIVEEHMKGKLLLENLPTGLKLTLLLPINYQ